MEVTRRQVGDVVILDLDGKLTIGKGDVVLRDALLEITDKGLGMTAIVDDRRHILGIYTDGDLRRIMAKGLESLQQPIEQVMTRSPKRILRRNLAAKAMHIMEAHSITSLFVFEDDEGTVPIGIVHVHDLLRAGVM